MVYHIDWFANIEEFLHLWDKAHLVMMYDVFDMLLYARILLRIFASMFISDIDLQFSFFYDIFVRFWYHGDGGLIEWVWEFSFLWNFLKEFE